MLTTNGGHSMKEIIHNYTAFYNMVLLTTLLANKNNEAYEQDAKKLIRFVGEAYSLSKELIDKCEKQILDDLTAVSTDEDVKAFMNFYKFNDGAEIENPLLQVKCDAIQAVEMLMQERGNDFNPRWFDYSNYKNYIPEIRRRQLVIAAMGGNVVANRTVALMSFLGIGKEADSDEAVNRLTQCVFWGDVPSILFLKHVFELEKSDGPLKVLDDLYKLSKYFEQGITVLNEEDQEKYEPGAVGLFECISSIKQDIILKEHLYNIDYSFVEAVNDRSVDYYTKLRFINEYNKYEWKEATNCSRAPKEETPFGFRMDGENKSSL